MNRPGQVKMKDVAERAGVSLMAVSLALRSDQSVSRLSTETRERILQAARELSYSPNARGRGLRLGVTNVIGLYAGYGFVNVRMPFFTEVVSGLQDGCEEFGKDLLLHGTFRNRSSDEVYNELRDGRIDGLVANMSAEDPLAQLLINSHLPVVAIADELPQIPSIIVDDEGGARMLADHLAAKGNKKCIYISGNIPVTSASRRRKAFLGYAPMVGIEVEEFCPPASTEAGDQLLKEWLERDKESRPTAFVCWNDTTAYGVLASCRQFGINVPNDVSVTGFDGFQMPYGGLWELTTVRAPWARVASLAVEHLTQIIAGKSVSERTVLPVELIEGRTS